MLKRLLLMGVARFERMFDYDAGYMREVIEVSPRAALRLGGLSRVSGFQGPSKEVWAGALLASSLEGDCGPCAQLVVDMAVKAGSRRTCCARRVAREFAAAGDVGLGFRFAEASIADDPEAETLRREIRAKHGAEAVIAAGFAAASGRAYPVFKRALGHGAACRRLQIGDGAPMPVRRAA